MPDEVISTPFGKFLIDPADIIGSTLKAGTLWDGPGFLQPIAVEFGRLGEVGTTILDVGANLGSFAVWLASRGAWRVIAVEPVPETLRYLKANLDLNQSVCGDHVIPLEIAAYDRPCQMKLAAPIDRGNLGGTALVKDPTGSIQATPLDMWQHVCGQKVSLIKIDAQGCDGRVLYGLEQLLQRDKPAIVFEWEADLAYVHGLSLEAVMRWLETRHYAVAPWPCYANNYLAVWR